MAKNKIQDLRNHLFAQLETLADKDLKPEEMQREIDRSRTMVSLSNAIIDTARVEIKYAEATAQEPTNDFFAGPPERPILAAMPKNRLAS